MTQTVNTTPAKKAVNHTPTVAQGQVAPSQQFNFFNPEHLATMQRVCTMFASSELVPEMYRMTDKNPKEKAIANCMIAVETAQRIGASPLMVMQNMYIVYGQPAWSAKFLTATVNGCGRYNSIKYKMTNLGKVKFNNVEVDNWECIAYTSEKGDDEILESIPVDIKMAIDEGWYGKKGSKWPNMPKLMLQYRAVTFWTRAYAPELSMGIKPEDEIRDYEDIPFEDVTTKAAAEIKEQANKQPVTFDQNTATGADGTPPAGEKKDEPPAGQGNGQPGTQQPKAPF
jgi:hypothetical protein